MPSKPNSLRDENIISDTDIEERLDYLAFLEDEDMSGADKDLWADEIEELNALRELAKEVGSDFTGLISEDYWDTYMRDEADNLYGLERSGAYMYFDYDAYASDMQSNYTSVDFLGTTYYY